MWPLLVLGIALLALWVVGLRGSAGAAAFMHSWRHVPLVAAVLVLLMALGAAIRG